MTTTTTTTTIFPIRVLSNWDTLFEVHPTCEYDNLGPIYALSTWHRIRSILDPSFLPPSPSPSSLVPPYPSPISPDSIPHTLNFYYSLMGKAPLPFLTLFLILIPPLSPPSSLPMSLPQNLSFVRLKVLMIVSLSRIPPISLSPLMLTTTPISVLMPSPLFNMTLLS